MSTLLENSMNELDLSKWYHHNLDPFAFTLFGTHVPWYWLAYLGGWGLCAWAYHSLNQKLDLEIDSHKNLLLARQNFLIWGWIGLILGARFTYILFYNLPYYTERPNQIFALWNGGMSFHGGYLGLALAGIIVARQHRTSVFHLTDPLTVVIPFAIFFGRIFNFLNGELPGRVSFVPWAVVFPPPFDHFPRHPSQIYEALGEGLLLWLIIWINRKKWSAHRGVLSIAFTGLYAFIRFFIEFTREPDPQLGLLLGFSMGQWFCLAMMLGAVLALRYFSLKDAD